MHTPGPWNTNGARVNSADGYFVADVSYARRRADEIFANANLIAAAPDLLAALESVEKDGVAMRGFHEQFRAAIRSAIAKAKGE